MAAVYTELLLVHISAVCQYPVSCEPKI